MMYRTICCFRDVADIMSIEDRQRFLVNLKDYLVRNLNALNEGEAEVCAGDQDFDFKLFLQMVPLDHNVPRLRRLLDDVKTDVIYDRHLEFYKDGILNRFKYRAIIRRIEYKKNRMRRELTLCDVFELAAAHYYQQSWGDGRVLKRDLEILTIK